MYENAFTPKAAWRTALRTFDFNGRSTRTELLCFWLFSIILQMIIGQLLMVLDIAQGTMFSSPALAALSLITFIPTPALVVRRFHDEDKTGWWGLLLLPPTIWKIWKGSTPSLEFDPIRILCALIGIGALVLLLWKPTEGPNHYGDDPRLDPAGASYTAE